jgi:predicted Zn finger-like uncharacterized protein
MDPKHERGLRFLRIGDFSSRRRNIRKRHRVSYMRKVDVQCPKCGAGYRRIEVSSMKGQSGEYRCLTCNHPLEAFTGQTYVAYRLTVQPEKLFDAS